jgi:hypothetical protein
VGAGFGATSFEVARSSHAVYQRIQEQEPVATDEAIRHTIAWEQANPPTGPTFHQFDYDAEDAALI